MADRLKIGTVGVTVEIGGSAQLSTPAWLIGDAAVVEGKGTASRTYVWRNLRSGATREWYAHRFRLLEDKADD